MDIICQSLQPLVDMFQAVFAFAWTPLTWFGFSVPPVSSWLNPLLPCTLT